MRTKSKSILHKEKYSYRLSIWLCTKCWEKLDTDYRMCRSCLHKIKEQRNKLYMSRKDNPKKDNNWNNICTYCHLLPIHEWSKRCTKCSLKVKLIASHWTVEWREILYKQYIDSWMKCRYTWLDISNMKVLQLDHTIPVSRWWLKHYSNTVLVHKFFNIMKRNNSIDELHDIIKNIDFKNLLNELNILKNTKEY